MRPLPICVLVAFPALLAGQSSYLAYSTYFGGNGFDVVHAIAGDSAGNVYMAGETTSSNLPGTSGDGAAPSNIFGLNGPPQPSAFVSKLSPAGQVIYTKILGSGGATAALGIAVDQTGNAYVTGSTTSTNFPTTPGAFQTIPPAHGGGFVSKISADGSALIYSTYLGGATSQDGYSPGALLQPIGTPGAIAVDPAGNVYVGGSASAADFPSTPGAYAKSGGAFVVKLNAGGSNLLFATFLGGTGSGTTRGIALDAAGNIYAAGDTSSADFPISPGAFHSTISSGHSAAFVVKLDPAGSHATYSAIVGGNADSLATALAVDAKGNAYIGGSTNAGNFPAAGAAQTNLAGASDGFVAELDATGSHLVYSTFLGGSANDSVNALTIDSASNVAVAGVTYSADFPVTAAALSKRFAGGPCLLTGGSPFGTPAFLAPCGDAFLAKLDGTGALTYSAYLSGSDSDSAQAVAVNADGSLWIAGSTRSTDFPVAGAPLADQRFAVNCTEEASPSSIQTYPCEDGFLARLVFASPPPLPIQILNTASLIAQPVSPAAIVTLFGSGIGPDTPSPLQIDSNGRVATTLSGTQVLFNGVPAPLLHVDSSQITVIVPNSVAGQTHAQVLVNAGGRTVAQTSIAVAAGAPALLTFDPSGSGQAAVINEDGTVNSVSRPAAPGSIVSLYAVGARATSDGDGAIAAEAQNVTSVQAVIGTPLQLAQVLYAGPSPGSISALTQVNVQLPAGVTGDHVPVWILAGGLTSQAGMTIAIH
ncbi:MAG TPA: SBBP repeat-containing protein [Bryobacteraceae bacterium]|nr:SBBP repeat-containing protein [Bryobacteraceae bacterium]